MSRRKKRSGGKPSPATWTILILLLIVVSLTVFSCNSIQKNKEQKKSISTLENEIDDLNRVNEVDALSYQKLYPDMMIKKAKKWESPQKTVYLTFDDGPTQKITPRILKTLKKENVKATFFVIGKGSDHEIMKDIVNDGHAIGIHTYSHNYKEIYKSIDAYVKDFYKIYNLIKEQTGVTPTTYRFPGGSNNVFNTLNQDETIAEMFRRGFSPFDWNVDSTDAQSNSRSAGDIKQNAIRGIGQDRAIILMHDANAKSTTADALPGIIKAYKKAGYEFDVLTNEVTPIVFSGPDGNRFD